MRMQTSAVWHAQLLSKMSNLVSVDAHQIHSWMELFAPKTSLIVPKLLEATFTITERMYVWSVQQNMQRHALTIQAIQLHAHLHFLWKITNVFAQKISSSALWPVNVSILLTAAALNLILATTPVHNVPNTAPTVPISLVSVLHVLTPHLILTTNKIYALVLDLLFWQTVRHLKMRSAPHVVHFVFLASTLVVLARSVQILSP